MTGITDAIGTETNELPSEAASHTISDYGVYFLQSGPESNSNLQQSVLLQTPEPSAFVLSALGPGVFGFIRLYEHFRPRAKTALLPESVLESV